jgi:hypothetical protein
MHSLKSLRKAGILENTVGGVTRHDLAVDRESRVRYRTVPDFMIAFAVPDEAATSFTKNAPQVPRVVGHLGDHQFRLFDSTELLPIDENGNAVRRMPEPRLENIRYNHLEPLDQLLPRRSFGGNPPLGTRRDPHPRISVMERVERQNQALAGHRSILREGYARSKQIFPFRARMLRTIGSASMTQRGPLVGFLARPLPRRPPRRTNQRPSLSHRGVF